MDPVHIPLKWDFFKPGLSSWLLKEKAAGTEFFFLNTLYSKRLKGVSGPWNGLLWAHIIRFLFLFSAEWPSTHCLMVQEWGKVKLLCHTLPLPLTSCCFLRENILSHFSPLTKGGIINTYAERLLWKSRGIIGMCETISRALATLQIVCA